MGRCLLWGLAGFLMISTATCKSSAPLETSTPIPRQPSRISPLPPPSSPLEIPVPGVGWMPMRFGADRGAVLVTSLSDMKSVALILPKKGNPAELEERVYQMVKTASPETKIVARSQADLSDVIEEEGTLPLRLSAVPETSDGSAYRLSNDHPLTKAWQGRKKSLHGADGVLIVRPVAVSDALLQGLVAEKRGDCSQVEKTLQDGMAAASAASRPFADKASDTMGKELSRYLRTALPFWKDELSKIAAIAETGSEQERCHDVYSALLSKFEGCVEKSCSVGPRLFARNGGIIGMPDPTGAIPDSCPTAGMRDYAGELMDIADRAVVEVLPALDAAWATELARLGGLAHGAALIRDACLPRHRRVDADALDAAKKTVVSYFEALSDSRLSAVWESVGGMEHVSGVGPVKVFARPKATAGDPGGDAARLNNALKKIDRCGQQDGQVYQVSVINPASAEILFMGVFFEENLLCEGMLPQ